MRYDIEVQNPNHRCRGVAHSTLDGRSFEPHAISLVDDGGTNRLVLVLGGAKRPAAAKARTATTSAA